MSTEKLRNCSKHWTTLWTPSRGVHRSSAPDLNCHPTGPSRDTMQASIPLSTRQKNCNTCVQSKRRCDRQTPICSRCAERDVPCTYGKPKKRKLDTASTFAEVVSPPSPSAIWFDPGITLDMGYLENPILESQSGSTYHAATSDMFSHGLISNDISMGVFNSSESANTSYPSSTHMGAVQIPEESDQSCLRSCSPIDDEILKSWEKMGVFCVG